MADYPTEETLQRIKDWDWKNAKELFDYLESLWTYNNYFKKEKLKDGMIYYISTAGWSGNEFLIEALQENFIWMITWQSSTRGGHYKFILQNEFAKVEFTDNK